MGNSRGLGLHLIFVCVSLVATTYTCFGDGNFTVHCHQKERLALLRLKESVEDVGGMFSSWVGNDCCHWERIHCHAPTGTVESLHLTGDYYYDFGEGERYLVGNEVNSSLAELTHLKYLDLSQNAFFGSRIPEFIGSFKELSYLNLSHAGFQGIIPPHVGNLSSLKVLDLHSNEGLIAHDMLRTLSLPSLEHLDLSGLNLSGWDMELYMFPSLKELSLAYCQLSNLNLDSSLNSSRILLNIKHLDLAFNSFKSPLPRFFRNMTSLDFLDLSNFNLSLSWDFLNLLNMIPSVSVLRLSECGLDNTFLSSPNSNFSTNSNIQHLDLWGNSIEGIFPSVLTNMSSLRVLRLSDNGLNSTVPIMPNLLELDLSFNKFRQIEHLGIWRQCHLKQLSALGNPFVMELTDSPKNVSECSQYALERLDLSFSLNGTIPESLGRLANLRSLDLSESSLTGTIPESLGRLRYLEALDLSGNQLDGLIPESFGNLTALKYLHLEDNQLIGTIPISVWQLTNLHSLRLSYNSLEGAVSESYFANLSMLKYLDASYNTKLTFNISREWMPPFQLVSLQLSSCTIANGFPQWLRNQRKLEVLELSNATISGSLPKWFRKMPIIPFLDLSHNKLSGPLTNLPNGDVFVYGGIRALFLEKNLLNESIPRSLCRRTDLEFLDLSRNRLTGKLPKCLGNLQNLGVMMFSSNQLSGVIPPELGTLEDLHVLDLGENKLSGYIPELIGEGLVSLEVFRLHKNNLTGRIPESLCKTSKLRILDVAYNNLTGSIPPCLRELNAMVNSSLEYLYPYLYPNEIVIQVLKGVDLEYSYTLGMVFNMDLSSNKLVGKIPVELTTLSMLVGLNLSNNHLNGVIPDDIGNMTRLESLDLSGNELIGMIPQSMVDLTFLSHLNLSHNNLTGQIPAGRQLQTLTDPSIYAGNKDLCGAPLPKNCSSQEVPTTTSDKKYKAADEPVNVWQKLWFYMDVTCGFTIGFWGVIGVFVFKKQWRQKVFTFVEETMDEFF